MKPRIKDMTDTLQVKYAAFSARMAEAGIPFALVCVIRSQAEQDAYFAQGRMPIEIVNDRRMTAGLSPITIAQNNVVTHTRVSRHFPNKDGRATAFDIEILRDKTHATYDLKYDGNADGIPDYEQAARIGESVGLEAGGHWASFHDWPHYQEVTA